MRSRFAIAAVVLVLVLWGWPARCRAEYLLADVSREQAKELGIAVRAQPSAQHDIRVEVEFRTAGRMKEFRWADLELTQAGKRLVTAALQPRKPIPDRPADTLRLEFYVAPAALPDASVTIFVANEALGGTGYRLKMKDLATISGAR